MSKCNCTCRQIPGQDGVAKQDKLEKAKNLSKKLREKIWNAKTQEELDEVVKSLKSPKCKKMRAK